jgi:hypothetical protein
MNGESELRNLRWMYIRIVYYAYYETSGTRKFYRSGWLRNAASRNSFGVAGEMRRSRRFGEI